MNIVQLSNHVRNYSVAANNRVKIHYQNEIWDCNSHQSNHGVRADYCLVRPVIAGAVRILLTFYFH